MLSYSSPLLVFLPLCFSLASYGQCHFLARKLSASQPLFTFLVFFLTERGYWHRKDSCVIRNKDGI